MKDKMPVMTSMEMTGGFFVQLIVNSIVIWLATNLFPNQVVLGNANSSLGWAIFHSMIMLSLIGTLAIPLFEYWQGLKGKMLTGKDWMIGYLVIDFVAIWVISRFSEQFGLGISAWWVGLLLAIVLDFAQGLGMMALFMKKKK